MYRSFVLFLMMVAGNIGLAEKVSITPEPQWLYRVQQDPAKSFSPGSASNGYYIELVDHQVNLSVQTEYRHAIRHITNESGVQNASEVSVTFAPEFQQVLFHKVTLWREGKVISQLNAAQIKVVQEETEAAEFQYNGLKRAFVIIKGVQKEDRIEYAYSIIGFNPVFSGHFSDKVYFTSNTVVVNYFETYIIPADRMLHVKLFNNATAPTETAQGNQHVYQWSNPVTKIQESQPGVPDWFNNYPYASLTEFDSWQEVANWGLKLFNNYQYPLTEELRAKVKQWQQAARGDQDMYTNLAIRFVQDQVRYLGLEIGAYTHQPHPPATIFRQRFGDCKDKALLLATLLQQEKIPAYVALVNTVEGNNLNQAAPSAKAFDHAIVAIERSSGYIYADATMAYQRGEPVNLYIPDYGYALLLRSGQSRLEKIEPGTIYNTNIEEKLDVPSADSCRLKVTTLYNGGAADASRSNLADASIKELEESYQNFYIKTYNGIRMAAPLAIADDSTKNQLTITEQYNMPSLWHTNEKGNKTIDVFAKSVYDLIPDPSNAYLNAPLALPFPRTLRYVLEIHMPDDWSFAPHEFHVKNDSYQFDFLPEVDNNIVRLRYYYKTFKDHIPAAEAKQYKDDYKKIEDKYDFSLYYGADAAATPTGHSTPSSAISVNWLMVLLALVTIGALTTLIRYLNKKNVPVLYTPATGMPLGGWIVLLGITLGISAILQIVNFIENNYFSGTVWKALEQSGGQQQLVYVAEMIFSLYAICGAAALLFWFVKRRDIFPRMFIGYIGTMLMGELILLTFYNSIAYPASYGDLQTPQLQQIVRTGIYGAVWISYVLRSDRVKYTFLQPFS